MNLSEAVSKWIHRREITLAASTISGYRCLNRKYVQPSEAGKTPLELLEEDDMIDLLRPLLVADHTRQAQLLQILVNAVLKDAVRHRLIRWNPMDCVDHVKHKAAFTAWLTIDEARQLLRTSRATNDPWYIAWLLMLCCGLRRGEMLGLQWADIDMEKGLLHVVRQRIRVDRQLIECKPKTLAGIREIYVDDLLLSEIRLQERRGRYILEGKSPDAMAYALDAAVRRAHVPRVTPHGLRHTMASAAASGDVSIKTLQVLLGHAHFSTTADIYTHVETHQGKAAAQKIAKTIIPARLEIV